jgi:hypothetical protein
MTSNNYFEKAQEAREYKGIAEALLEKDIKEKDRAKLELFVGFLEGIESRCLTLAELPAEERRKWIAQKEGKELEFLNKMKTKLPGTPEQLEFIITNPEATLYAAIELMNGRYGGK